MCKQAVQKKESPTWRGHSTVSSWMVETRLCEKRRARQTERGNSRGAVHSIKRARVRLSARDCTGTGGCLEDVVREVA